MDKDEERRGGKDRREDFIWPHPHCEDDCPVAIRNSERISTLFIRMDEMKVSIESAVKWKQFIAIITILLTIFGIVNTMIYDSYQRDREKLIQQVYDLDKLAESNRLATDIAAIRLDNFGVTREDLIARHRQDHSKLDDILLELHKDLKILNRYIGHKYMIDDSKTLK